MKHFSAAEWFEFVRDSAAGRQNGSLQRHLDEGCQECGSDRAFWQEFLEIGSREPSYTPPLHIIEAAKAAFFSRAGWEWLRETAQLAGLVFDSLLAPMPVEIRGSTTSSRQFLQEAKPFMVDLRMECEPARRSVRLNGQVLNSNKPDEDVTDVDVFLLKGENLATKTSANTSGEFDLDFQDEEDLQLFIDIRGRKIIEVRLPSPLADCKGTLKAAE